MRNWHVHVPPLSISGSTQKSILPTSQASLNPGGAIVVSRGTHVVQLHSVHILNPANTCIIVSKNQPALALVTAHQSVHRDQTDSSNKHKQPWFVHSPQQSTDQSNQVPNPSHLPFIHSFIHSFQGPLPPCATKDNLPHSFSSPSSSSGDTNYCR